MEPEFQKGNAAMHHALRRGAALVIRVVSIPPIMVTGLLLLLALCREDVFSSVTELLIAIGCLAIVPVLAYPISALVPALREKKREGQRNLAFVLSLAGYLAGWLYGELHRSSQFLRIIFTTYLLSVLVLLLFNKVLHVRASGHGCSVTGPLVFLAYFFGVWGLLAGALLFGAIFWASVAAKRHTPQEFLLGAVICLLSGGLAWLLCTQFMH